MKSFDFEEQLSYGRKGVEQVLQIVGRDKLIQDFEKDENFQKRGIDLELEDYGFVEVKTDNHISEYVFLETHAGMKPGACFTSRADVLFYLFPKEKTLYVFPLPQLQEWLATNSTTLRNHGKERVITSHSGKRSWSVTGLLASKTQLMDELSYAEEIKYDQ